MEFDCKAKKKKKNSMLEEGFFNLTLSQSVLETTRCPCMV